MHFVLASKIFVAFEKKYSLKKELFRFHLSYVGIWCAQRVHGARSIYKLFPFIRDFTGGQTNRSPEAQADQANYSWIEIFIISNKVLIYTYLCLLSSFVGGIG